MKAILYLFGILFPLVTLAQQTPYSVPEFTVPADLNTWHRERAALRETLIQVMGKVPARPAVPNVHILSREEKPAYTVEKFEFDNGGGATVPGYFLIPKSGKAPYPAIFYCHWHGGNYDLGKQEIFT